MNPSRWVWVGAALMVVLVGRTGHGAPAVTEVERLEKEVRELRQLVMQLMRVEKEHYDLLMNLVQQGRTGEAPAAAGPEPSAAATGGAAAAGGVVPHAVARTGPVHGKVQFTGGTLQDVFAYVENVKSPPAHGKTVDIAQRGKQFVPEVMVVQRGTKVAFPNYDTVFHNVFSPTPPHPFDLGSYRAGEGAKAVEMTSPGVVEIFCNMHSSMHASILVVPSPVYTRVDPDGSFHLEGVPVGTRTLVVWGPHSKPVKQTVEVRPSGAEVTVVLEARPAIAHNNKFGQPYPSYEKN